MVKIVYQVHLYRTQIKGRSQNELTRYKATCLRTISSLLLISTDTMVIKHAHTENNVTITAIQEVGVFITL